ncbi:hypothetical protein NJR55_12365 [Idiomarina sp. M1R2S28]|uniref:Lipid A biosynthesis acyltransferase n=1 Tax=Idiomarina rhizosphaerae TaxID=2961572 RepID=A0A9X2FWA9_9GAMM|nr:hypothetical protein [Idiomarina rhizosphaerae]MCP1340384.1 hypothetical protein [Idiomarina rhizosphaerae]
MDLQLPSWSVVISKQKNQFIPFSFLLFRAAFLLFDKKQSNFKKIKSILNVSYIKAVKIDFLSKVQEGRNVLDQSNFNTKNSRELNCIYKKKTVVEGVDAKKRSIGTIYVLNSFCLHYFGILHGDENDKINVVQPERAIRYLLKSKVYDKLEDISNSKITTIVSDSNKSMITMVRKLKKGESLFLRIDSLPTNTQRYTICDFFGKPSVFPTAILKLSEISGAEICPMFSYPHLGKYVTIKGNPLKVESSDFNEYTEIANKLNKQSEEVIKKFKDKYTSWHAIYEKKLIAEKILEKVYENRKFN